MRSRGRYNPSFESWDKSPPSQVWNSGAGGDDGDGVSAKGGEFEMGMVGHPRSEVSSLPRSSVALTVPEADDYDYEMDEPDLPTHINLCCKSCTPQTSFPCRILYFLVILGLDLADLFSDWLLYIDVSMTEEGLVYGPPEMATIYALLAFSVVGTVTFFFEGVNLWYEVFRNNPWLDTDLVSAVIIWVEDLPQISISVYIAMCREDPISVFQLSKASVVLVGLMIRIIITSVKYCNKAALRAARLKTRESRRHVLVRAIIMLGLIVNAGCAVTIFVFTQTERDLQGSVNFQIPDTIFEEKYHDERYFQNVSVFVHHPDFDAIAPNASNQYQANWVRFMSINDIRDQDDLDISYNYVSENTDTHLHMALYVKKDDTGKRKNGKWALSECYRMAWSNRHVQHVDNSTCTSPAFFSNQSLSTFITFSFTPPDTVFRKLIFGDIRFNLKVEVNGQCLEYDNFTDNVNDNVHIPAIHYYRIHANIPVHDRQHMLLDKGSPRFYRNDDKELTDITQVWKTGWGRCESSGSIAPHLRRDIPTECSNIASRVAG